MTSKAVSVAGTVKGRPDETWRFVVEVPEPTTNPNGDPNGRWVYTNTFDTQEEAVNYATAVAGAVRVRSYKQIHMPADYGIAHDVFTSRPVSGPDVPMQEVECVDHPKQKARIHEGGQAPRCPECRVQMVGAKFAAKVRAM